MKWFKIEIHTETEAVDIMTYLLEENGIEGVVIEDPNDIMFTESYKGDWDYSEETARQFDHEDVILKIFVEGTKNIEDTLEMIQGLFTKVETNGLNVGSKLIKYEVVNDEDWKDKWKEYFKTFKIGKNIIIKPSWEEYEVQPDDMVIEMDPGSAFGSGTHETTSMCVALLEKVIQSTDLVYDIGCGTGILGLVAAKMGAQQVLGVDIAEDAIIATRENIEKNNLSEVMSAQLGSLTEEFNGQADVIVANIMADILIMMNETLGDFIKKDGYYISSGIVNGRENDVLESVKNSNFEIVEHVNEGEWHAILARYKG